LAHRYPTSHMTRTPLSRSKDHQPGLLTEAFTHRQLQRSAWEHIQRGKLLLPCGQARSARRREVLRRPQREERGGDISWRPPARLQLVLDCNRLLRDRAADLARCMGLCAHSTCRSTVASRELSANDSALQI